MSERKCVDGWLKTYREYTRTTEVPDVFSLWSGITGIALLLGRKCYVATRPTVYPNLYTVLVAESAWARKTTAIRQIMDLLRQCDCPPRRFAQKTTVQATIRSLKDPEGPIITDKSMGLTSASMQTRGAEGIFAANELTSLLDRNAFINGMIAFLTDIWDSTDESYVYDTREHGQETITDPCIYLLGGTTVDWLKQSVPIEAIGGGFTSRILFVSGQRVDHFTPWPEDSERVKSLELDLIHDLNQICQLAGPFKVSKEAKEEYSRIYIDFAKQEDHLGDVHLRGYAGRRGVFLHKIGMVVSASYSNSHEITSQDYIQADLLLKSIEKDMAKIMQAISATEDGERINSVLSFVKTNDKVSRSVLTRRFSHLISAEKLELLTKTLEQSGQIQMVVEANKVFYRYVRD